MLKELYSHIDDLRPLVLELQRELTAIPAISPDGGGEGENAKARYLADKLAALGFPEAEWIKAPDPRVPSGVRPSLYTVIPGRDRSRTFWIISHLDIVPPGNLALWESDPFNLRHSPELDPDLMYGRGVEDNQQGIVSSILAALAAENSPVPEGAPASAEERAADLVRRYEEEALRALRPLEQTALKCLLYRVAALILHRPEPS